MAVAPTGAIYKALEFDGESSASYGVYITGQAVYNAPVRDVEMITIPNRNGAFALDNGRFENVTITYPAGIFADAEIDFAKAISDFRNFLCSKKGYVRLTDDYNPSEYRMAIYKSGLEVEPTLSRAGEFEITFECKPQRYLMSGETPIDITSGDEILNPTLFDAQPLLALEGYGTITVDGQNIELSNETVGTITLADAGIGSNTLVIGYGSYESLITPNDPILLNRGFSYSIPLVVKPADDTVQHMIVAHTATPDGGNTIPSTCTTSFSDDVAGLNPSIVFNVNYSDYFTFSDRGASAYYNDSFDIQLTVMNFSTGTNYTASIEIQIDMYITPTSSMILVEPTSLNATLMANINRNNCQYQHGSLTCTSSKSILGTPTYVDCEIGEAYKIENNIPVSLNAYIDLGSDLPTLSAGSNEITYDNTFTDVKITPRWWKV